LHKIYSNSSPMSCMHTWSVHVERITHAFRTRTQGFWKYWTRTHSSLYAAFMCVQKKGKKLAKNGTNYSFSPQNHSLKTQLPLSHYRSFFFNAIAWAVNANAWILKFVNANATLAMNTRTHKYVNASMYACMELFSPILARISQLFSFSSQINSITLFHRYFNILFQVETCPSGSLLQKKLSVRILNVPYF
jgi:hypothetical protein